MDGLMAIPAILAGAGLMALMRGSVRNVIVALVIPRSRASSGWCAPPCCCLASTRWSKRARALGVGTPRILLRYILPGAGGAADRAGDLHRRLGHPVRGLPVVSRRGHATPHSVVGQHQLAEGKTYVQLAFWIILFPGLFLALTVLAINLVGDGLRDLLHVRGWARAGNYRTPRWS